MNPVDYLVLAVLVILLFFAVRYAFRHRDSECGGNCSSCPYSGKCARQRKKK